MMVCVCVLARDVEFGIHKDQNSSTHALHLVLIEEKANELFHSNIHSASAIKCWRCSSDAANAGFCNDPFDGSIDSDYSYVECGKPSKVNERAVCIKTKKLGRFFIVDFALLTLSNFIVVFICINSFTVISILNALICESVYSIHFNLFTFSVRDEYVIVRSCHWEKLGALRNECFKNRNQSMTSSSSSIIFCETCANDDGCNAAAHHIQNALLTIFLMSIAKVILF